MEQTPIVIDLSPTELEPLNRPINGEGGYQSMLRQLQRKLQDGRLIVSEEEAVHWADRIDQYVNKYGQGGFQGRLKAVADKLRDALRNRSKDS